jgi:hypothetical protein
MTNTKKQYFAITVDFFTPKLDASSNLVHRIPSKKHYFYFVGETEKSESNKTVETFWQIWYSSPISVHYRTLKERISP